MKLRILNSDPNHWLAVHKDGCRDLRRYRNEAPYEWAEDHETLRSCAISVSSDFIKEGSMTEDESLEYVYFYPCVTLPES